MSTKQLQVVITGDAKGVQRALGQVEASAGQTGSRLTAVGAQVAKGIAVAGAAVAVGAAVAGKQAVDAALEAQKISRETDRVIRSTSGVANVTAADVGNLATSLSDLTGVDDEVVQSGANLLLTFTKVRNEVGKGNDVFDRGTALALDMAEVLGTDMQAATIQVGKALNDPIKGVTALTRAGVSFTQQQKDQIRTLVESGDTLSAQKLILDELTVQFGGAAEAAATPMDRLKVELGNVQEAIGGALLPAVVGVTEWLRGELPGAVDLARQKWYDLQPAVESAGDLLLGIGDRVRPAWDDLWSAGENVVDILDQVVDSAEPAVGALAKIGGATVLGAISGTAAGIEGITGFLADNQAALDVVIATTLAWSAMQAWPIIVGAVETIYLKWLLLQGAVTGSAVMSGLQMIGGGFLAMGTNATVGAGMVRSGMATIAGSTLGATAGIGAAVFAAVTMWQAYKDSDAAAKEWRSEVEADIDPRSISSVSDAVEDFKGKARESMAELDQMGITSGSIWDRAIGYERGYLEMLTPMENKTSDAAQAAEEAAAATKEWAAAQAELERKYASVGAILDLADASVEGWVKKLDLDPATMSVDGMVRAIRDAKRMAEEGTPATDTLAGSFEVLGDETASSTDQLTAWREAMDAVIGVHLSAEEALIQWGIDVEDTTVKIAANKAGIEGQSRAARENRLSFIDMAQQAIDTANTVGETSGYEAATYSLATMRQQIIDAGVEAGISRADMEAYVNTLGLTPDNITTAVGVTGLEGAEQAIEHTTRDRNTTVGVGLTGQEVVEWRLGTLETPRWTSVTPELTGEEVVAWRLGVLTEPRTITITADYVDGGPADSRMPAGRWGAVTAYAKGGVTPAHITRDQVFKYGEPETGGEAFIPRLGNAARSRAILEQAAGWYGMDLIDRKTLTVMAAGGVTARGRVRSEDQPGWNWITDGNGSAGADIVAQFPNGLLGDTNQNGLLDPGEWERWSNNTVANTAATYGTTLALGQNTASLAGLTGALGAIGGVGSSRVAGRGGGGSIDENSPGWNWRTMGNGQAGADIRAMFPNGLLGDLDQSGRLEPGEYDRWRGGASRSGSAFKHGRSFDSGGVLLPGWNLVENKTGEREPLAPLDRSPAAIYEPFDYDRLINGLVRALESRPTHIDLDGDPIYREMSRRADTDRRAVGRR